MTTIGIIGEGKMGADLFYHLLPFPFRLCWLVSPGADLEKIQKTYARKVRRMLENDLISEETFNKMITGNLLTKKASEMKECDLIIEAIPEDIEMKRTLFSQLDLICKSDCIFASNSSSFLPSLLSPSSERAHTQIGLHFFYPVALKNICEIIINPFTDQAVIKYVKGFLKDINRFAILQTEENPFLLNRLFLDLQNEAFQIKREGILDARQIDVLIAENLIPGGVFELFDHVGIDVILPSIRNYAEMYGNHDKYAEMIRELEQMVHQNKLGRKTCVGFYSYLPENPDKALEYLPPGKIYLDLALCRLHFALVTPIRAIIDKGLMTKIDLLFALKEYLGGEEIQIRIL